jgi:tetratricopeptide (TPR) repeat protein
MGRHLYWGYFDYDHARAEVGLAARTLPNNPIVFQLTGLMDRRQSRWAEAVRNLERASELDPRNENYLINLITTYKMVQDYDGSRRALDRWHLLKPNDYRARLGRAEIERDQRADLQPWRHELLKVMAENPGSAAMLKADRFYLATLERDFDTAASVAAELPEKDAFEDGTQLGHTFYMGVVARLKGNAEEAKNWLTKARLQQEQIVRAQPEDGQVLCGLAMIDAGLGRKEEALREAWRAIELAPISKNSLHGAIVLTDFAIICGWTGEYDLAFKQLEELTQIPGGPSYGELRLSPMWDPLRGDPRFDKIVALLAPKDADSK